MLKFLSEVKGSRIVLFQEQSGLGVAQDYLFDHEKGKLLGVYSTNPLDKTTKFIPASEFKGFSDSIIIVNGLGSLSEIEDIIRAKEVAKTDAKIISEKVETESGKFMGKVSEAALDVMSLSLERLYVRPKIGISSLTKELIIPASKIVEIQKNKIIISDGFAKQKAKEMPALAAISYE